MSKITYTNKVALNVNPDVADVNKCNATDMNEIKQVVNENDDNVGDITQLNTTDKTSIVNAINEVNQNDINKSTYSTTEQVVGKWIDGKPLYRKTFSFNESIQTNVDLTKPHNIENADLVFIDTGSSFMYNQNYECYTIIQTGYSQQFNDKLFIHVNRNNFTLRSNAGWGTSWVKVVTLLYTKTTD